MLPPLYQQHRITPRFMERRQGPEQHTRVKTTQDESKPRRPLSNTALTAPYLTPDPHLNHVLCQTHTTNSLVIAHYTNRPTYNFRHQSCCSSVKENKVWQPKSRKTCADVEERIHTKSGLLPDGLTPFHLRLTLAGRNEPWKWFRPSFLPVNLVHHPI